MMISSITEKKKRYIFFAILLLSAFLLAGCSRSTGNAETEPLTFQVEDPEPMTGSVTEPEETVENLQAANSLETALKLIAVINKCDTEELNIVYDSEGYVSFLGNKFTLRIIRSQEEAMSCLEELNVLCGLEGLQFQFGRKDVSPVSGVTYYTLTQVVSGNTQGQPISYFSKQIRVFTDKNGNAIGFSCDVDRNPVDSINEEKLIGRGEAEAFVNEKLTPGSRILSGYSELVFWTDSNNVSEKDSDRVIPVWRIYSNEPREGKAFTVYLVYAYGMDNLEQGYVLAGIQPVQSPRAAAAGGNYTSELFFTGMQPAGEFTYELNMSWAKNCYPDYEGKEKLTVTVPVMYDPESRLYYLADVNERLAVSNYYDFDRTHQPNPVISDNPYDLNSWHFENETITGEDRVFFFDPNYVLASYSSMCSVYMSYKERYGLDSVDTSGLPILLNVYYFDGNYPEVPDGFYSGTMNCGRLNDWAVFVTSPSSSGSADFGTLAREFANGIHSQLTGYQVLNGQGAISAGFADAVGEQLAYLCGEKYERYKWLVGSQCAKPVGSFFDPYSFEQAKYLGGAYYVSPVSDRFSVYTGSGGVRANCGAVNYLAFSLCKSPDTADAVLSIEQNLDLWFETVYCMNYLSGFEELGAYLRYAAGIIGALSDEQIHYVNKTTEDLGFGGSGEKLQELIGKEKNQKITITFLSDDADDIRVSAKLGEERIMGMTGDDGLLTYLCPEAKGSIELQVLWKGAMVGKAELAQVQGSADFIIESHILTAQVGTEHDFGNEVILSGSILKDKKLIPDAEGNEIRRDLTGAGSVTFAEDGIYCILTENKKQQKNSLYVIRVEGP